MSAIDFCFRALYPSNVVNFAMLNLYLKIAIIGEILGGHRMRFRLLQWNKVILMVFPHLENLLN